MQYCVYKRFGDPCVYTFKLTVNKIMTKLARLLNKACVD